VPTPYDSVYDPSPLKEYSLFERFKIRAAAAVFYAAIRLIGSTVNFEVRGMEHFDDIERDGKVPIYAFWHDRIFLGTYFWRNRRIVVMTSKSFDGEYIARFIQRFGYGAIRGSSSRGGSRALVEMIKAMRKGLSMAFTIDGPRGPRYEAKAGPTILAKKSGNPIMPFVIEAEKFWTAKSWDRMQIPKPFTRALLIIRDPIYVPENTEPDEAKLKELQKSMDSLVDEGRAWRESV
jgi:hypothetical protein